MRMWNTRIRLRVSPRDDAFGFIRGSRTKVG